MSTSREPETVASRRTRVVQLRSKSIYLEALGTPSLGRTLARQSRATSDGSEENDRDDLHEQDLSEEDAGIENEKCEEGDTDFDPVGRTLKGWETRRFNERIERARLADPILESEDAPTLPSDEILHALHHYTSNFYTQHSLLLTPKVYERYEPRETYKRRLLLSNVGNRDDGLKRRRVGRWPGNGREDQASEAIQVERRVGTSTKRRVRSVEAREGPGRKDKGKERLVDHAAPERSESGPDEADGEDEEDEGDGEGKDNEHHEEEDEPLVAIDDTPPRSKHKRNPTTKKGTPREVGKYKRRDMREAFDGTALIALGILVEEHIAKELRSIGYTAGNDECDGLNVASDHGQGGDEDFVDDDDGNEENEDREEMT